MPSSKKSENPTSMPAPLTKVQKAARLKEIEDAVKEAREKDDGILPKDPKKLKEIMDEARELDENQRRHEKEFRGLTLPLKKDEPRSR